MSFNVGTKTHRKYQSSRPHLLRTKIEPLRFNLRQGTDSYVPVTSIPDTTDPMKLPSGGHPGTGKLDASITVQKNSLKKGFHLHVLLMKQTWFKANDGTIRSGYVYFTNQSVYPDGIYNIYSSDSRFAHISGDPLYEVDFCEDGTYSKTFQLDFDVFQPKNAPIVNYLMYLTVVDVHGNILDQSAEPISIK